MPEEIRNVRVNPSIAAYTFAEDIMSNLLGLLGSRNLTENQLRPLSGLANI